MTAVTPCPFELAELVCATRPDWDRAETDGAIRAAGLAGWTWERTVQTTVRLACTDGLPRDLVTECRSPLEQSRVLPPDVNKAVAADARQLLTQRLDALRATDEDNPERTERAS